MAETLPKDIINAFIAALRANTGTHLSNSLFRKGPGHAIDLRGKAHCVFVALVGMPDGEQSAGIGNQWWHNWALGLTLCTPDSETDREAAEDSRLDLLGDFLDFIHSEARCVFGTAKVGRIRSAVYSIEAFPGREQQVWLMDRIVVTYRSLRS